MSFANDILDAIEIIVKQVVEDNVTKIYTGVCKTIGVNSCVLTINGKDNTVKYYGGVPVVGTVYQVFIPFGNMSAAFIIVPGSGGGSGGGSGSSGVNSVNGKTGDVVLNAADVSALPNTTTIPSKTSQLTNDSGYITESSAPVTSVNGKTGGVNLTASDVGAVSTDNITQTLGTSTTKVPSEKAVSDAKVSKSGDTMTGKLTVPQVETGAGNSNFFQCRKFRGEGDANTYYHAIDFGYKNHDQVDFHEYGGKWNFYKNQSGKVNEGVLCGSITSNGWEGRAKLKSGSTMVTSQLTENSDAIATTAFVHGLVDNVKHYSASNPPPYPVTSVNGHTGAITVREVPAVTTTDNGKFLRVVNGAWAAVEIANANGGSF